MELTENIKANSNDLTQYAVLNQTTFMRVPIGFNKLDSCPKPVFVHLL